MSRPATILLIRHGTNPKVGKGLTGWLPGVSLDTNGLRQAHALAAFLANRSLAAIYSSPLERTLETAAPLARLTGLEIVPEPAFGEVRFGDWQGKDFPELECDPIWSQFNEFRNETRAPGGELMLETQARMAAALLRVAARHPGREVAVFSHADAIKAVLCWVLGISLDFHQRLEIQPASVTTLVLGPGVAPLVRSINVPSDVRPVC